MAILASILVSALSPANFFLTAFIETSSIVLIVCHNFAIFKNRAWKQSSTEGSLP